MQIIIKCKGQAGEGKTTNFSFRQVVYFPFDDNLPVLVHYFCSYFTLRDGPASEKNMSFGLISPSLPWLSAVILLLIFYFRFDAWAQISNNCCLEMKN